MAQNHDPSLWESIGIAITGLLTGAGAILATKRRARTAASDRVRGDIRKLQDSTLTMTKDIQSMQEALKLQAIATEQLKQEHDVVIAELFREIRNIGLNLKEVATEVRMVIRQKGIE